jgi:hypothetical protein
LAKDKTTGEFTDKYPANFKAKVPFYDGIWKCSLYNDRREEVVGDLSASLTGECDVRAILKCNAVWFAGGKFGVSWSAEQLEYRSDEEKIKEYAFRPAVGEEPRVTVHVKSEPEPEGEDLLHSDEEGDDDVEVEDSE